MILIQRADLNHRRQVMVEKRYPACDDSLTDAISFVEEELSKINCSEEQLMQVTMCLEEMFVNVAHYAYVDDIENGIGEVVLQVDVDKKSLEISLIDKGKPFNPLAKKDPDIDKPLEERPVGGLGIYMVKKCMDEVEYTRDDNKNIFVMKKNF